MRKSPRFELTHEQLKLKSVSLLENRISQILKDLKIQIDHCVQFRISNTKKKKYL